MWPFNHTRPSALSMTCNPPSAAMTAHVFLTRSFYVLIYTYRYTCTKCSTWNIVRTIKPRLTLFFDRLDVQAPPEIPAGNRAIRSPRLSDLRHHSGLRPLALPVVPLDGRLHAIIANRQNIRMPQGEHQEHVRRPDANPFDLSKMRDNFFFRQFGQAPELQEASRNLFGEVAQIRRL